MDREQNNITTGDEHRAMAHRVAMAGWLAIVVSVTHVASMALINPEAIKWVEAVIVTGFGVVFLVLRNQLGAFAVRERIHADKITARVRSFLGI